MTSEFAEDNVFVGKPSANQNAGQILLISILFDIRLIYCAKISVLKVAFLYFIQLRNNRVIPIFSYNFHVMTS